MGFKDGSGGFAAAAHKKKRTRTRSRPLVFERLLALGSLPSVALSSSQARQHKQKEKRKKRGKSWQGQTGDIFIGRNEVTFLMGVDMGKSGGVGAPQHLGKIFRQRQAWGTGYDFSGEVIHRPR
jgi:hypothetical protein